jgi:hypothetical protein
MIQNGKNGFSQGFIEKLKNFFSKEKENEENSDLEQEPLKEKRKKEDPRPK